MSIRDRIRRWLGIEPADKIGLAVEDTLTPLIRELRERDEKLQAEVDGLSRSLNESSKGLRELIDETQARLDRHRDGVATTLLSFDSRITSFANVIQGLLEKPKSSPRRKAKS